MAFDSATFQETTIRPTLGTHAAAREYFLNTPIPRDLHDTVMTALSDQFPGLTLAEQVDYLRNLKEYMADQITDGVDVADATKAVFEGTMPNLDTTKLQEDFTILYVDQINLFNETTQNINSENIDEFDWSPYEHEAVLIQAAYEVQNLGMTSPGRDDISKLAQETGLPYDVLFSEVQKLDADPNNPLTLKLEEPAPAAPEPQALEYTDYTQDNQFNMRMGMV